MSQFEIFAKLAKDAVQGIGMISNVRQKDKDKDGKTLDIPIFYVEVTKMGASLTFQTSKPVYQELCAAISGQEILLKQSIIQYDAEIEVQSDAFAYGEGKAMATSKYGSPFLTSYKKVS